MGTAACIINVIAKSHYLWICERLDDDKQVHEAVLRRQTITCRVVLLLNPPVTSGQFSKRPDVTHETMALWLMQKNFHMHFCRHHAITPVLHVAYALLVKDVYITILNSVNYICSYVKVFKCDCAFSAHLVNHECRECSAICGVSSMAVTGNWTAQHSQCGITRCCGFLSPALTCLRYYNFHGCTCNTKEISTLKKLHSFYML